LFRNFRNIQEEDLDHSMQNFSLEQKFVSGKLRPRKEFSIYEEGSNWLDKFLKKIEE
jgi:hypothetical protein